MEITNAQYTATGSITALVDGVQMSIPADTGNRHYAAMVEQGITPAPYVGPSPTNEDVNAERDRRILLGGTFTLTDYGTVRIAGDATTTKNLQGLAFGAQIKLSNGDTTSLTPYRDEDDVIHQLTPEQIVELWSLGAALVSSHFEAAWTIKDDPNGIPLDFEMDKYWP